MAGGLSGRLESRIDGILAAKAARGGLADGFKGGKTVGEVLDRPAVMALHGMLRAGTVGRVHGPVGAGKESVVFRADGPGGSQVALKVYLVSASSFKRRARYMDGDPRFGRARGGTRGTVYAWARKEFANLRRCRRAGVPVPEPIAVSKSVLAMGFVGSGGAPAPTLAASRAGRREYEASVGLIGRLYRDAGLVHGDLSPYNVFADGGGLVVFDLGSAVDVRHPGSAALLARDINNMTVFFARRGLVVENPADVLGRVAR